MRKYDRNSPLIVIHVPKAAGSSSRKFFEKWYGEGFLTHYFDELRGNLPTKYDLFGLHSPEKPIVLHGHFNKQRHFGVEDYYPDINQFVTILRDPFELAVSSYFYMRKNALDWKDKSRIPTEHTIDNYLINTKSRMLNHFPREVTSNNYQEIIEEYFIEVGLAERLEDSMKRIAQKLGMPYDGALLGHYNATARDQEIPDYSRDLFIERNQLEFAVYTYALEKFTQQDATPEHLTSQLQTAKLSNHSEI